MKTTKSKVFFFAPNVPVLHFSHKPDALGDIIPPEAYADFKDSIPITFGNEGNETVIGRAYLMRIGNKLVADLDFWSKMKPPSKALGLIRKLYPCLGYRVSDRYEAIIMKFSVEQIILSPHGNSDLHIGCLGTQVDLKTDRRKLN